MAMINKSGVAISIDTRGFSVDEISAMYDGADPSFDADLLHRTPALSSSQV
jgi:hypothetical protein